MVSDPFFYHSRFGGLFLLWVGPTPCNGRAAHLFPPFFRFSILSGRRFRFRRFSAAAVPVSFLCPQNGFRCGPSPDGPSFEFQSSGALFLYLCRVLLTSPPQSLPLLPAVAPSCCPSDRSTPSIFFSFPLFIHLSVCSRFSQSQYPFFFPGSKSSFCFRRGSCCFLGLFSVTLKTCQGAPLPPLFSLPWSGSAAGPWYSSRFGCLVLSTRLVPCRYFCSFVR